MFFLMIGYMLISSFKSSRGISYGHEASYITAIGFLISCVVYYSSIDSQSFHEHLKFNDNVLFYVCIPPIVFASGYNMRRKRFFQNFKNIMIFGVFGTLVTYIFFASLTMLVHSYGWMTMWDSSTKTWVPLELSTSEILLMSSLLCSTDVIAAISMVKYEE